jgi:hypothetical protein
MELDLIVTDHARLTRDDDGGTWCALRSLPVRRFRVMPEKPLTMQHAAGLLGLTVVALCETIDRDATAVRVSEIRLMAGSAQARKVGGR